MSNVLTLGDFTFSGIFECPEFIKRGGSQNLAVHDLIGGVRIVDAMGRINDDIGWTGSFLGITAEDEAQYLNYLMTQGNALTLTYSMFQYLVIIKEFTPITKPNFLVDYSIVCTVIEDQTQPVTEVVPAAFDETILNDLINGLELAFLVENPSVTGALALLNAAVLAIPNLGNANPGELVAAAAAASSAVNTTTQALAALSAEFGGGATLTANITAYQPPATDLVNGIIDLEKKWKKYESLEQLLNVTTRIQRNIQIQQQPSGTEILLVVNRNLFEIAVERYGDLLQWTLIAEANTALLQDENGFVDPFIYGMKEIVVPPKPTASTNGIMSY